MPFSASHEGEHARFHLSVFVGIAVVVPSKRVSDQMKVGSQNAPINASKEDHALTNCQNVGRKVSMTITPSFLCRCSKIMSPLNCNETLSPCEDGDNESERVSTGESD
jgi:hypothetical protein